MPVQKKSNYAFGVATWVWVAYYTISSWFVLSGLTVLVLAAVALSKFHSNVPEGSFARPLDFIFYVGIAMGAVSLAVGAGLLLQNEFVRSLANFYCYVRGFFGLLNTMTLMGGGMSIALAMAVMDLVSGVLMIYLIYETNDTSGF